MLKRHYELLTLAVNILIDLVFEIIAFELFVLVYYAPRTRTRHLTHRSSG